MYLFGCSQTCQHRWNSSCCWWYQTSRASRFYLWFRLQWDHKWAWHPPFPVKWGVSRLCQTSCGQPCVRGDGWKPIRASIECWDWCTAKSGYRRRVRRVRGLSHDKGRRLTHWTHLSSQSPETAAFPWASASVPSQCKPYQCNARSGCARPWGIRNLHTLAASGTAVSKTTLCRLCSSRVLRVQSIHGSGPYTSWSSFHDP